jgi:hypothetical protein
LRDEIDKKNKKKSMQNKKKGIKRIRTELNIKIK